ncbi:hypothetical protein DPMN_091019 [Dreissena polymorpha]|uniref:Uncharacterized protein n=1 Tax=Dreissena polymorpha TaxID=45954 RepID=A0A9D4QYU5_DREPO|nr:hypothetical protein DPMN_091019 [Dreissena polymorpha]
MCASAGAPRRRTGTPTAPSTSRMPPYPRTTAARRRIPPSPGATRPTDGSAGNTAP